jgi:hypothetical protein
VVSFTPWPLYLRGKIPQYPLDRRLGGPQSQSGYGVEEKNSCENKCNVPNENSRSSPVVIFLKRNVLSFYWKKFSYVSQTC